ncbi:hypothetical protein Tco_1428950 [Tanacetum coccineum]
MLKRGAMCITCTVTGDEFTEFLDRFVIPSGYDTILPDSSDSAFDASPGYLALAYGGEPTLPLFRSLLTLVPARDSLSFQKCHGALVPSIFKAFMLHICDWKSKFIFVRESLFSDQCPSLVTPFKHHPGTFSFPFPSEPFDASLRARLSHYPIELRVFSVAILYWSTWILFGKGPLCIQLSLLMARVCFHLNRHVKIADVPVVAALSEGSPDIPVASALKGNADILGVGRTSTAAHPVTRGVMSAAALVGSSSRGGRSSSPAFAGERTGAFGPLVTSEDDADSDPFLPGDGEAHESHNILSGLDHPDFQRRLDGLSLVELAIFHDVSSLKFVMSGTILNREARLLSSETKLLCAKGKSPIDEPADLKVDAKTLWSKCRKFEEKEAIMLATEASLKTELEVLKEKLDSSNEDRSLMVADLLPHAVKTLLSSDSFSSLLAYLQKKAMLSSRPQAFKEVVGMDLGFHLEDVKDYDPDAMEAYDKAIDDFYFANFPDLDLLAYHSKRSLGPSSADVMSAGDEGVLAEAEHDLSLAQLFRSSRFYGELEAPFRIGFVVYWRFPYGSPWRALRQ